MINLMKNEQSGCNLRPILTGEVGCVTAEIVYVRGGVSCFGHEVRTAACATYVFTAWEL